MKRFIRNPETGIVEIWEEGKKVGEISTMGDDLRKAPKKEKPKKEE